MKLQDLIAQKTKTMEPPQGTPAIEKVIAAAQTQPAPLQEEKKKEAAAVVAADVVSEADILLAGEINVDLFCSSIEVPCIVYTALQVKKKKKKARLQMIGVKLDERLKEIDAWKKENDEIIYFEGKEYDKLKRAFTNLARLNKGKPDTNLMIGGAVIAALAKRAPIFFE